MNVERPDHLTEEQLHGAAEGSLADRSAGDARRHLEGCNACRSDVERIRALLAATASLPRAIEPPDDAWAAIRARVGGSGARPPLVEIAAGGLPSPNDPVEARPPGTRVAPLRRTPRDHAWLAAAALLLVVATSAITMLVTRDEQRLAGGEAPGYRDSLDAPIRFRAASDGYDRLDRELARRLDAQREILQPETIEKVERNLRIIDRAIGEIRQALAEDPNNEALELLLKASYGQKSALLQQVSGT